MPATYEEEELSHTVIDRKRFGGSQQSSQHRTSHAHTQRTWTAFDDLKLSSGLELLNVCASFLRVRCECWLTHFHTSTPTSISATTALDSKLMGMGSLSESIGQFAALTGLLSINTQAVTSAFMACAEVLYKQTHKQQQYSMSTASASHRHVISDTDEEEEEDDSMKLLFKKPSNTFNVNTSLQWLQARGGGAQRGRQQQQKLPLSATQELNPATSHVHALISDVAENLICVLHTLVITAESDHRRRWRLDFIRLEDDVSQAQQRARKGMGMTGSVDPSGMAACVLLAEQCCNSSHSFIGSVARWMRDNIEQ